MALKLQWRTLIASYVPGSSAGDDDLVTFKAKSLVSFLLACGHCNSRSAAVQLGEHLRQRDIIRPSVAGHDAAFTDSATVWTCRAGESSSSPFSFSVPALLCQSSYVLCCSFGKQGTLFVNTRTFVLDRGTNRLFVYSNDLSTAPRYYLDFASSPCTVKLLCPGMAVVCGDGAEGEPEDTDTEPEGEDGSAGQAKQTGSRFLSSSTQSWGFSVVSSSTRIVAYTGSERRARLWAAALAAAATGAPCRGTVSHYQQKLSRLPVNPPGLLPLQRASAPETPIKAVGSSALPTTPSGPQPDAIPLARSVRELLSTPHATVRVLVPPDWAENYAASLKGALGTPPGYTSPWSTVPELCLSDEGGPASPPTLLAAYEVPLDTYCRAMAGALGLGGVDQPLSSPARGAAAAAGSHCDLRPLRLLVLEPWRLHSDVGIYVPCHARAVLERAAALVPLLPFEDDSGMGELSVGSAGRKLTRASSYRALSRGTSMSYPFQRSPSVGRELRLHREQSMATRQLAMASMSVPSPGTPSQPSTQGQGTGLGVGASSVVVVQSGDAEVFHAQRGMLQMHIAALINPAQDSSSLGPVGVSVLGLESGGGAVGGAGADTLPLLTPAARERAIEELAQQLLPTMPASTWSPQRKESSNGQPEPSTMSNSGAGEPPMGGGAAADTSIPLLSTGGPEAVQQLEADVCESWAVRLLQLAISVRQAAASERAWLQSILQAHPAGGGSSGSAPSSSSSSSSAHRPPRPSFAATGSAGVSSSSSGCDLELDIAAWATTSSDLSSRRVGGAMRGRGGGGDAAGPEGRRARASSADRYMYGMSDESDVHPSSVDDMAAGTGLERGRSRSRSRTGSVSVAPSAPPVPASRRGGGSRGQAQQQHAKDAVLGHVKALMVEQAVAVLRQGLTPISQRLQACVSALHALYGQEVVHRVGVALVQKEETLQAEDETGEEEEATVSPSSALACLKEDLAPILSAGVSAVRAWPRAWALALQDWGTTGLYIRPTRTFAAALGQEQDSELQRMWRIACRISKCVTLSDRDCAGIAVQAVQRVCMEHGALGPALQQLYRLAYAMDDSVLRAACTKLQGLSCAQMELDPHYRLDECASIAVLAGLGRAGGGHGTEGVQAQPLCADSTVCKAYVQGCEPWIPLPAIWHSHIAACAPLGLPLLLYPFRSSPCLTDGEGAGTEKGGSITVLPFPDYKHGTPESPAAASFLTPAVELLQLLPSLPSPAQQASCLVSIMDLLCKCLTIRRIGQAGVGAIDGPMDTLKAAHVTADDLLGLLAITVVSAVGRAWGSAGGAPHTLPLASMIAYLSDMAGDEVLAEQPGFVLTSLQAALMYVVSDDIASRVRCGHCEGQAGRGVYCACVPCGRQLCRGCCDSIHAAGTEAEGHEFTILEMIGGAAPASTAAPSSPPEGHLPERRASRARTISNAAHTKWLAIGAGRGRGLSTSSATGEKGRTGSVH